MALYDNEMDASFHEYIDLEGHIDFAESLVSKYEWEEEVKKNLLAQLNSIHAKQKDKCLNLSVIGEFSTGKSSFINALLGENLLVSSAIQGTTVVNTVIEYYPSPLLYVLRKNGIYDIWEYPNIEELSVKVSEITTNPTIAKDIKLVRVGIPSSLLQSGIRIIDTPGTNSVESWHEDVTKEALRDLSDLSIILTDAIHPVTSTLLDFIYGNLTDIYSQCAFVVTYYDRLAPSDREDVLRFIRKKLTSELDIENPPVFPFVAPALMAAQNGTVKDAEEQEMASLSAKKRDALLQLMEKKRQLAQIKKLLALTKIIFKTLDDNISSKKLLYEKELELLLKTRQTSLEPFIEEEKLKCCKEFRRKTNDTLDLLQEYLDKEVKKAKENIRQAIIGTNKTTANEIQAFLSNSVPIICNNEAKKIIENSSFATEGINSAFLATIKSYHDDFRMHFKKLGLLNINMDHIQLKPIPVAPVSLATFKSSMEYMAGEVSKENWVMGGGGVAGAAIGTAILPGIGTIVGGLVGLFMGAMATPTPDEMKKKTFEKLSGQLDAVFNSLQNDCISNFRQNVLEHEIALKEEIDRYLKKYKKTVDRLISEQNCRIENNKAETEKTSIDLKLISLRREQLKSLSSHLNQ